VSYSNISLSVQCDNDITFLQLMCGYNCLALCKNHFCEVTKFVWNTISGKEDCLHQQEITSMYHLLILAGLHCRSPCVCLHVRMHVCVCMCECYCMPWFEQLLALLLVYIRTQEAIFMFSFSIIPQILNSLISKDIINLVIKHLNCTL